MHKYLVEITETLQRQFDVEAQSKEEAEKIANMMYRNGDVVLNAEDFVDARFTAYKKPEIDRLQEGR
jgi:hypothetical protein